MRFRIMLRASSANPPMIYLVRHGQTEFNRDGRIQGRIESRLTERGERQAAAMADRLHGLIADDTAVPWRIVSSPLGRAVATAQIIGANLGLPVETDERLIEICVGEWEGRFWHELANAEPDRFSHPEWFFQSTGGETYEEVMARVTVWLSEQAEEPDRHLIVVSHGIAGRLLRGAYAGLSRELTVRQDVSQDAIYRLSGGRLDRIECSTVA